MKTYIKKKPREYKVGFDNKITIKDYGRIKLDKNEQISFIGDNGLYDFCRKNWGFYSTPSINKRLKNNKFETYLVKNIYNNIYLWAVEKNKKKLFIKYLKDENHDILLRLDKIETENDLIHLLKSIINNLDQKCDGIDCRKKKANIKIIYKYKSKPKGEPNYKIKDYRRKILQCINCGHFFADHLINTSNLYKKDYSLISHGENLKKKFYKILSLKSGSDNFHRINRIIHFFKKSINNKLNLLDIGSGLGIFLFSLKKKVNWNLSGIEPDINFYKFSKNELNLNIYNENLYKKNFNKKFQVITLNKVLEHVKSPNLFLNKIRKLLEKKGFIYIEVPDGIAAKNSLEGKNREEFYLDHLHVFSVKSLTNCLTKSKFNLLEINRIKEKSGKYTIYAFAQTI